jgi:hypothetical protein
MSLVGFEPTITVFERTKTFHALDRATTVSGYIPFFLFSFLGWGETESFLYVGH